MTLQECYAMLHGNYEDVKSRLSMDRLIEKFMLKFPDDTSMDLLNRSVASGDIQESFRAAHTLKGVCSNLGFTKLYEVSSELTEILRGRELKAYEEAFAEVEKWYQITVDAIKGLN